jgi:hypothetical protein
MVLIQLNVSFLCIFSPHGGADFASSTIRYFLYITTFMLLSISFHPLDAFLFCSFFMLVVDLLIRCTPI